MFEEASQSEKKSQENFLQLLEIRQLFETAYLDAKSSAPTLNSLLSSSPQSVSTSVSPVPNEQTSSESPTKMAMKNEIFEGISPITPNKFICIHFPLNVSNDVLQTLQRPTGANIAACSALTRFNSFKLDEKLMTYSEPLNITEPITSLVKMKLPACDIDELSRSDLDLSNTNYDQSSLRVE